MANFSSLGVLGVLTITSNGKFKVIIRHVIWFLFIPNFYKSIIPIATDKYILYGYLYMSQSVNNNSGKKI